MCSAVMAGSFLMDFENFFLCCLKEDYFDPLLIRVLYCCNGWVQREEKSAKLASINWQTTYICATQLSVQLPFECIVPNYWPTTQLDQPLPLASVLLIQKSSTAQNSFTGDQIIFCAFASLGFCCSFRCLSTVQSSFCFWADSSTTHARTTRCTAYGNWPLENMLLSSIPLISPTDVKSFLVKQSIINCTTNQGVGGGFGCNRGLKYSWCLTPSLFGKNILLSRSVTLTAYQRNP